MLAEYRSVLCTQDFDKKIAELAEREETLKKEAKEAVENAPRREKKQTQTKYDELLSALSAEQETARQAKWLFDKFGEGEYRDGENTATYWDFAASQTARKWQKKHLRSRRARMSG